MSVKKAAKKVAKKAPKKAAKKAATKKATQVKKPSTSAPKTAKPSSSSLKPSTVVAKKAAKKVGAAKKSTSSPTPADNTTSGKQSLPPFSLKGMTCSQLADLLEKPAERKERKQLADLRIKIASNGKIGRLRMCGEAPARYYSKSMETAANLENLPALQLMIGGGKPRQTGGFPRFTAALKAMGKAHGITVLRWGSRAYRQATMEKTNEPSESTG